MTQMVISGRQDEAVNTNYRTPMRVGLAMFAVLVVGLFGWMGAVPLAGAVIANGSVIVRGKPQLVQHLDGGLVKVIDVRNGDLVRKGDVLVRLDEATLVANLDIYRNRLREATAKKARLEAERDGRDAVDFGAPLTGQINFGEALSYQERQINLFNARRASRRGEVEKLKEKIEQIKGQIGGLEGLIKAKNEQLKSITSELDGLRDLLSKGIATRTRVLNQERMQSDVTGQLAEHTGELARASNAIRETEVSIIQVDRQFKETILSELTDVSTQIEDLTQQISATQRQLDRVEIKAPVTGIVHELNVNTIGGTVPPNATLMQVIATEGGLDIEVSVDPHAIDQVAIDQDAVLRFPAFNQRTTPELNGKVERISPSSVTDEKSGMSFYRVKISLADSERARLGDLRLVPGMPVEVFIRTSERTTLSYLLKPLTDNFTRALRER